MVTEYSVWMCVGAHCSCGMMPRLAGVDMGVCGEAGLPSEG